MQPNNINKKSSKVWILIVAVMAVILLIMGGFIWFVFGRQVGAPGGDPIAERFLTDKIQADKKADIIIFSDETMQQPGFMAKVDSTKQLVREGGYTSKPILVRPANRNGVSFQSKVAYKLCKPTSDQDCVYFLIERNSRGKGGRAVGSLKRSSSTNDITSFSVYATEAEAASAYDQ